MATSGCHSISTIPTCRIARFASRSLSTLAFTTFATTFATRHSQGNSNNTGKDEELIHVDEL